MGVGEAPAFILRFIFKYSFTVDIDKCAVIPPFIEVCPLLNLHFFKRTTRITS